MVAIWYSLFCVSFNDLVFLSIGWLTVINHKPDLTFGCMTTVKKLFSSLNYYIPLANLTGLYVRSYKD